MTINVKCFFFIVLNCFAIFKRRECILPLKESSKSNHSGATANPSKNPEKNSSIHDLSFNKKFTPKIIGPNNSQNLQNPNTTAASCSCGRVVGHEVTKNFNLTNDHLPDFIARTSRRTHTRLKGTVDLPTNAFGTLEFRGTGDGNKSKYLRLTNETSGQNLENVVDKVLFGKWGMNTPNLVISVIGCFKSDELFKRMPTMDSKNYENFESKNFETLVSAKARKVIGDAIIKAADTAEAWIITDGLNTGVSALVGHAFKESSQTKLSKVKMLGVSAWGVVENKQHLVRDYLDDEVAGSKRFGDSVFQKSVSVERKSQGDKKLRLVELQASDSRGRRGSDCSPTTKLLDEGVTTKNNDTSAGINSFTHLSISRPYPTIVRNRHVDQKQNQATILNPNCGQFLFVDDGTEGKCGRG